MDTKPLIGISANYAENNSKLAENYYKSVVAAGGIPVIVPVTTDSEVLEKTVSLLDGIICSGGGDMSPSYYGEEAIPEMGEVNEYRDRYDYDLCMTAIRWQLPILGICRGMQTINIAFGGSLYQDIKAQADGKPFCHSQDADRSVATQTATIDKESLLYKIVGTNRLDINSIHHQAVKRIADGLRAVAHTDDGICEAIESVHYPILGVQWHPEHLSGVGGDASAAVDNPHLNIFRWLIGEAKVFNRAKSIHGRAFVVDSHCDTPMFFHYPEVNIVDNVPQWVDPADFDVDDEEPLLYEIKVDAHKMRQGRVDAVFMVAYIPQNTPEDEAHTKAEGLLTKIVSQARAADDKVEVVSTIKDLERCKRVGKPAIVLGIENGYALGEKIDNIDKFYRMGVRYITLCHNGDNQLCDSAMKTVGTHNGLSDFGRKAIERMNSLGIMVDVSHAGEKTFWDTIELSTKPIIASHSCCKALCRHPRNLTDDQIRALAAKGGVLQICLYKYFLSDKGTADITDAVRHIMHVVDLVGADYVGIGSDFDGGGGIGGCEAENEIINITKALVREGLADEQIINILGGNLLRVLNSQS